MTLNGILLAVILRYFSKLDSSGRALRKVVEVEDIPKLSTTEI